MEIRHSYGRRYILNMDKKKTTTPHGGSVSTNGMGDNIYDLTKSSDILKDMNHAIMEETKKSGSSQGATEWFIDALRNGQIQLPDSHDVTVSLLSNNKNTASKRYMELPGRMFAFMYRPKTRAELQYYDITPLIITLPTENTDRSGNILGINLHYLDPDLRAELIDRLLRLSSRRTGEKDPPKGVGYFRINYDLIRTIRFVFGMPCIRSYDPGKIIGRPVLIPSNQWGNAVALPCENFVKARGRRVWVETRLKIREFIRGLHEME